MHTYRPLRQLVLEGRRQRRVPLARVNVQDLPPRGRVRQREAQLAVEAARAAQRRVHGVGAVGGSWCVRVWHVYLMCKCEERWEGGVQELTG